MSELATARRRAFDFDEKTGVALRAVTERLLDPSFQFPALPDIAAEVTKLASASDVDFRAVDRLIRRDPVLAARVLSVANSPMYSVRQPITSLRTAMMIMGWQTVREILWQVVAESHVFRGGSRRQLNALRQHAVGVGHLTRQICRELHCESEFAFVCGLLHDIGRPLALQIHNANPDLFGAADAASTIDAIHTHLGERVADAWNLPAPVGAVARHHHDFDGGVVALTDPPTSVRTVAAAERLSNHHGLGGQQQDADPEDPVFMALGLDPAQVLDLIERTSELRAQIL